jgi:hypothetical protein
MRLEIERDLDFFFSNFVIANYHSSSSCVASLLLMLQEQNLQAFSLQV